MFYENPSCAKLRIIRSRNSHRCSSGFAWTLKQIGNPYGVSRDRRSLTRRDAPASPSYPPNRTVYGNQTWEEMMQPFFGVVVDKKIDPQTLLKKCGPVPSGAE